LLFKSNKSVRAQKWKISSKSSVALCRRFQKYLLIKELLQIKLSFIKKRRNIYELELMQILLQIQQASDTGHGFS
jgi:hypothetical protein